MKRKLTSTWVFALAMVLLAGCESPYSDEYIVDMSIYHVTVLSSDEGKGTVSGGGSYQVGSQITIHATAKEHCYFTRWSDGNTQAKRQISVTSDTTLTAEFAINRYTITAYTLQEEYGQVTGSGTYDALSTITLEAVPNVKYVFVKWSDGDTNAKRQISVTSDATYIAYFKSAKGDK